MPLGAAMARVSASVDLIQDTSKITIKEAIAHAAAMATEKVIANGADPQTAMITEQEALPLQYLNDRVRTIVKAVGDFVAHSTEYDHLDHDTALSEPVNVELDSKPQHVMEEVEDFDFDKYRPVIRRNPKTGTREWIVSVTDLDWLRDGCYVLGCGGGGSPDPETLKLKRMLIEGHCFRIIDAEDLTADARIYCESVNSTTCTMLTCNKGRAIWDRRQSRLNAYVRMNRSKPSKK